MNTAADAYTAAFADANTRLDADEHWQKLSPDDKHAIRADMGLLEVPRSVVASPEDIVAALTSRSLSGWADLAQSLPAKVQRALDEAAARFEPKARPVKLPMPGLITNMDDAERWLNELHEALKEALTEGPVLPRL